jgi:hypothetical protein
LNYSDSLPFHGGDTGSTPVRDANYFSILRDLAGGTAPMLSLMDFSERAANVEETSQILFRAFRCWSTLL